MNVCEVDISDSPLEELDGLEVGVDNCNISQSQTKSTKNTLKKFS